MSGVAVWRVKQIFFAQRFFIVVAAFLVLLSNLRRLWAPYLVYFCLAFALAAYVCRGVGVDINAWIDFFIAAAIVFGIFAGSPSRLLGTANPPAENRGLWRPGGVGWSRALFYAVLISAFLPLSTRLHAGFTGSLDSGSLERADQAYRRQVNLLRSIPGPALYENLLLGFDAGKEFLYEPFNAAQQMTAGRMRESILTDAIERREFGAIVLEADLDAALCGAGLAPGEAGRLKFTTKTRWTPNALKAVALNYEPLGRERFPYYFYVPLRPGAPPGSSCIPERPKANP
ncbi:MAG TPA: hypothetical protein VGA73_13355 [Candidatus Binatia bacterium]